MKCLLQIIIIAIILVYPQIIYSQDGLLDSGFGTSGLVINYLSTNVSTKYDAAVQPDDKIVFVGDGQGSNQDFMIIRYNADGTPDNSLGTNGIIYINIIESGLDDANAVVIQPDGKIVVAGFTHYVNIGQRIVAVIRLNSDGTLDDSFDGDGIVTTDIVDDEFNNFDEFGQAVALQSDGKIVVAGNKYLDINGLTDREIMVIRYNSDGSPDSTFDADGIVLTNITGGRDESNGVAVQPDGKIVVTGRVQNSNYDLIIIRYNSDGSLDNSFSTDGYDVINFGSGDDAGNAVEIQSDNKIIVGGTARGTNNNFAVVRYNDDGTLDTGFDIDGITTIDFSTSNDMCNKIALLSNGKILAAGRSGNNFGIIRLSSNGSLDTGFGTSGKTTTDFNGNTDVGYGIAIQSDGKIVVPGTTFNFTDGAGFAFARYTGSVAPLPVELVSFTSKTISNKIQLTWQTATEINNYGFTIQRSKKSEDLNQRINNWEEIGFINGSGNSNSVKNYTFTDENILEGSYLYRLKQIDIDGSINFSQAIEVSVLTAEKPGNFGLLQNYPNPFNPETTIEFVVSENSQAVLEIYNMIGEKVAVLFNDFVMAGKYYKVRFNASNLASGIYYARLQSGSGLKIKKMIYLK